MRFEVSWGCRAPPPRYRHGPSRRLLLVGLAVCFAAAACRRSERAEAGTVEVRVQTVALDDRSQSPVVILEEREGSRRLPIWIGPSEASSIVNELRKVVVGPRRTRTTSPSA